MENSSTEGLSSTANHHSFASVADGNASEESGWTSYIDYFMETQRQRRREEASSTASPSPSARGSTWQYSDDYYVVGGSSSRLPALIKPSEASRRLISLKKDGRRRKKKVVYDESLEDTATSPISSPKLIELREESDANHRKKEDARDEFSHYKIRTTTAAELVAGYNNLSNNGANTTTTDMIDDDCEYDSNELRKKGLCLVPVSAFHV